MNETKTATSYVTFLSKNYPLDTGRKLNVQKKIRSRGRLLHVLCSFILRPASRR